MSTPPPLDHLVTIPTRPPGAPARDLAGTDLDGSACAVEVARPGRWSLLLFLGPGCDACVPFWSAARAPGALGLVEGDEVVTVVREDADVAAVRSLLETLPAARRPVVVTVAAWRAYGVQGPPVFVLVDGERVVTEGVAWSVAQVAADVRRARTA